MLLNTLKKPFYVGAVALFATTTFAITNPTTHHVTAHASGISGNSYDRNNSHTYGLTQNQYDSFDHNALLKANMNQDTKDLFLGESDGLNNRTKDTNINSHSYNLGYYIGQTAAQGYLAYLKYGDDTSKVPYMKQFNPTGTGDSADSFIAATYFGYRAGINDLKGAFSFGPNHNNDATYNGSDALNPARFYTFAANLAREANKNGRVDTLKNHLNNSTPFGFSITDTNVLNVIKDQLHLDNIFANGSVDNVPNNVLYASNGHIFDTNKNDFGDIGTNVNSSVATPKTDNTQTTSTPVKTDTTSPATKTDNVEPTNQQPVVQPSVTEQSSANPSTNTVVSNKPMVKKTMHKTVMKKHVKKAKIKKIYSHIPHTVYAKHRLGIHSTTHFNHGKVHFVAKNHKFHVYYKISDGHGNYRYNVGKHQFITVKKDSVQNKPVKKHVVKHAKKHIKKHVISKHHKR